ncbi:MULTISPECIES: phage tail tube protein [unclassified Microbacterium]|uniref:phage tail tube protein n=1 Tax=unclassified Microbacterium TaxID=2609290 RepID=UPI003017B44B
MSVNAELARIFGSDLDAIHLAPIGTTLPTTIDGALDAAFDDVGWLSDDGLTESLTGSVEKKRGHQGNGVVRTRISEPGTTVTFQALESKAQTNGLRYHEKTATSADGVRHSTRGPGQRITARAAVIDVFDADETTVKERYVIPRLEISPNGDRVLNNKDISAYPFIGEIIGDYDHFATDLEDVTP